MREMLRNGKRQRGKVRRREGECGGDRGREDERDRMRDKTDGVSGGEIKREREREQRNEIYNPTTAWADGVSVLANIVEWNGRNSNVTIY